MSNINSKKEELQYCLLQNGKEKSLLTGATLKMAVEFYSKYHPGEKFYKRTGDILNGFHYEEVEA